MSGFAAVDAVRAQDARSQQRYPDVDDRSAVLLEQMQATYKAMQSYSVQIDVTRNADGKPETFPVSSLDLKFRRPDHLVLQNKSNLRPRDWRKSYGMDWAQYRSNGKEILFIPCFGTVYARFPLEPPNALFGDYASFPVSDLKWLITLFSSENLPHRLWQHGYSKIKVGQSYTLNGVAVQTVIAISEPRQNRTASELAFAIGSNDHRLYQSQQIVHYSNGDRIETVQYRNITVNPVLAESQFSAPVGFASLSPMDVVNVNVETIVLSNKERKARVGDRVFLFENTGFHNWVKGYVRIMKVNKDTCDTEALLLDSSRPGIHGFLLPREQRTKPLQ